MPILLNLNTSKNTTKARCYPDDKQWRNVVCKVATESYHGSRYPVKLITKPEFGSYHSVVLLETFTLVYFRNGV